MCSEVCFLYLRLSIIFPWNRIQLINFPSQIEPCSSVILEDFPSQYFLKFTIRKRKIKKMPDVHKIFTERLATMSYLAKKMFEDCFAIVWWQRRKKNHPNFEKKAWCAKQGKDRSSPWGTLTSRIPGEITKVLFPHRKLGSSNNKGLKCGDLSISRLSPGWSKTFHCFLATFLLLRLGGFVLAVATDTRRISQLCELHSHCPGLWRRRHTGGTQLSSQIAGR